MKATWWILGDRGDVRTVSLRQELARVHVDSRVIDYRNVLQRGEAALAEIPDGATVRFEAPGRAHSMYQGLLAAGADEAAAEGSEFVPAREVWEREDAPERLRCSRQWYLGFRGLLRDAGGALRGRGARIQNDPAELAMALDKSETRDKLARAGVPVPRALGAVRYVEDVHRALTAARGRGFLKPRHGSSAAGVMALRLSPQGALVADTTIATEGSGASLRLHNTRNLRRLVGDEAIGPIIDALAPHHMQLEEWVPKAGLDGMTFDLRILTIAGEPRHAMVRMSRGPITNLHLRNRRASIDRLLAHLAPSVWGAIEESCRATAAAFPGCLYLGLDVLVTPGLRGHRVLEVNGFGDLIKGARHQGLTPYEAEVRAWQERVSS